MQALSTDLSDAPVSFSGSPFSRFGFLANFCTLGSVVMCFGQTFLVSAIAFFGLTSVDAAPHVQAILMWVLALFAVIGLARDRRQHGDSMPLLLGIASLVILLATLYVYYHWAILTLAFFLLISAVFLNQNTALKSLYAKVQAQARQLEEWNQDLTARVNDQVERIERLDRLKHFLSPQVAELVMNAGGEDALASHRREITALFCDLRGFTAFSEGIEPEEAMDILQSYHRALDALIMEHNGTIDHRAGDGLMVIFNDPVPCDDPVKATLMLALAMREKVRSLAQDWRSRGYELGFGIGIASGYATLGVIGSEGRFDYTANGNVVNLASRLCDAAQDGQIVISRRALAEVKDFVEVEPLPPLELKGISNPVQAFNVLDVREVG